MKDVALKHHLPGRAEIDQLIAFLPHLYAPGFVPVKSWGGGAQEGVLTMPWPIYDDLVLGFMDLAGAPCWCDYRYQPEKAAAMLRDPLVVSKANLAEVRTMLTYCVRGERFCDGHWAAMIEDGHVRRLLERLEELVRLGLV